VTKFRDMLQQQPSAFYGKRPHRYTRTIIWMIRAKSVDDHCRGMRALSPLTAREGSEGGRGEKGVVCNSMCGLQQANIMKTVTSDRQYNKRPHRGQTH